MITVLGIEALLFLFLLLFLEHRRDTEKREMMMDEKVVLGCAVAVIALTLLVPKIDLSHRPQWVDTVAGAMAFIVVSGGGTVIVQMLIAVLDDREKARNILKSVANLAFAELEKAAQNTDKLIVRYKSTGVYIETSNTEFIKTESGYWLRFIATQEIALHSSDPMENIGYGTHADHRAPVLEKIGYHSNDGQTITQVWLSQSFGTWRALTVNWSQVETQQALDRWVQFFTPLIKIPPPV